MTWQPEFVCPECRGPLRCGGAVTVCTACDLSFRHDESVRRYLTDERRCRHEPFLTQYRLVRQRDGHVPLDDQAYRALPHRPLGRASAVEWAIRAESLTALLRSQGLSRGAQRVLDVGAGNGWLSQRLAGAGHAVVAVDINDDGDDGLLVARRGAHDVALVQADFDGLPFAPAQFDVVVLNASLHYAPDAMRTLESAYTLLVPGGRLVVMDSPWFEHDADGEAMVAEQQAHFARRHGLSSVVRPGLGYLTFRRLQDVAVRLGRVPTFTRSVGPLGWRLKRFVRQARATRPSATFGVWMTQ